ncbi:MAG: sorbosone dehydrogenase family protein, partial [Chthoniobacterales bacterium]|nr:sorbosone dehydrogenase family protein [Chthoniobacterales bacterium]
MRKIGPPQLAITVSVLAATVSLSAIAQTILSGKAAVDADWTKDAPGVRHKITPADLPPPYETESAVNDARVVARPPGAQLQVPFGFKIQEYASGFRDPRYLLTAANGDIFVTEGRADTIKVLRDANGDGKPEISETFASDGLKDPFGIAFYPPGPDPQYLYVANTDGVVRIPYRNGDIKARGPLEKLSAELSSGGLLHGGGHWTRDLTFSADGKKMYVSIGSRSNVSDDSAEANRARIFEFNPDGTGQKVFAWGVRNAVGIKVRPGTNDLWMSVNERDGLGDGLVPDYISRVQPDRFYGWPWYYIGNNQDPRHKGKHPELAAKVAIPDLLVQSHSATLNLIFYDGEQFPAEYKGDIFAAFHGSWNKARRTGYKIVRVPLDKTSGKVRGDYEDFVTGFVTPDGKVWGRPVGLTVAKDGSLLFSEDGNKTIWRVTY